MGRGSGTALGPRSGQQRFACHWTGNTKKLPSRQLRDPRLGSSQELYLVFRRDIYLPCDLRRLSRSLALPIFRPTDPGRPRCFPEARPLEAILLMLRSPRFSQPKSEQSSGRGTAVPAP